MDELLVSNKVNPFMPTVAFNICCPRDAVSWIANVERNGGHKCVKSADVGFYLWTGRDQLFI